MLHRFTVPGGRVSYANRFLETRVVPPSPATRGASPFPSSPPTPAGRCSPVPRRCSIRPATDSAKVNIARVADHYLALAETPIQVEFDPADAEDGGRRRLGHLDFGRMTTVHPHLDDERARGDQPRDPLRGGRATTCSAASTLAAGGGDASRVLTSPKKRVRQAVVHPLLRHVGAVSGARRVPARGQSDLAPSLAAAVHRELPVGTRAGHALSRLRSGHGCARPDARPPPAFFAFHHVNAYDDGTARWSSTWSATTTRRVIDVVLSAPALRARRRGFRRAPSGGYRVAAQRRSDRATARRSALTDSIELPSLDYARRTRGPTTATSTVSGVSGDRGFYDQLVKIDTADPSRPSHLVRSGLLPGRGRVRRTARAGARR